MVASRMLMIAAVLTVLSGCLVGPDYHPPQVPTPAQFSAATRPSTQPAPVDLTRWWTSFNDPQLDGLIQRAVISNLDVKLAEARVREARAQLAVTRAGLFPTLDSSASYSRSRISSNLFGSSSGAAAGASPVGVPTGGASTAGGTGAAFGGREINFYRAGFDANWEIDVFGGTRRAVEAASDTLEAQLEARRNALVTLLSEVAADYANLRGYQYQLSVVRKNVAAQQDTLRLQRERLAGGLATQLNVAQAEAQVAATMAQIPTLEAQVQQMIHAISVLLDREPTALEAELAPEGALPAGPPVVPPGLPSELLRRRPDIRQAERQLAAATANIGVATADLFPKFSLTGSAGVESTALKTLANASSGFWSFGPTVSWRIFDAGQIRANIRVFEARQEQALIQYRLVVLQAFREVDDALVAYDREQRRRESLQRAVAANHQAVALSLQLNRTGLVDFLNVLTSQQALYLAEVQLARSNQAVATNLVALYKALGGGWEIGEPPAAGQ